MDGTVYINLKSGEITDNIDGYIHCDMEIAPVIRTLNQKGYITKASCAGHYPITIYEYNNCDIEYLEKIKKDPLSKIIKIRKKDFAYYTEARCTSTYILFQEKYDFKLPEGFYTLDNAICHDVYFHRNHKRRKMKYVLKELEKYQKILENWANELPINERKDEK